MKTKYTLISLLILILVGCQDEAFEQHDKRIRVFASSSLGEARINYTEGNGVTYANWDIGDIIGLLTDSQKNLEYQAVASSNGSMEFAPTWNVMTLQATEGQNVYAYYPRPYYEDVSDMTVSILNPNEGGSFVYAKGKVHNREVKLQFKHIYSYLKITITKDFLQYVSPILSRIEIQSERAITLHNVKFDLESETVVAADSSKNTIVGLENGHDLSKTSYTAYIPILPQPEGTQLRIIAESNFNPQDHATLFRIVPKGGFKVGHVYSLNTSREDIVQLQDLQKQALIDLYNATDGDNWINNTNWCSDKPIYMWYGVNNDIWGSDTIKSLNVVKLLLFDNGLKGELPESFALLMEQAESIALESNALHGVIPEKVRKHPRWNEFGWGILRQNLWLTGGKRFDMTDINLFIKKEDDMELEYLTGGNISILELFAKNKISHVMIDTPSDERANQHLSYHNKGFGTIVSHIPLDETREETIERVKDYPISDIVRLWDGSTAKGSMSSVLTGLLGLGSSYLIDSEGKLIDYYSMNWEIPESWYNAIIDSVLYARLGEPEEHPIFSSVYTSTDYSRDGEVMVLQKASAGKGIDLVFMGDGFVDRDMDDGGKYEKQMQKCADAFFSIEPYKTFRDRFNVYAVKVVSPNDLTVDGGTQRINLNDAICFEYASKIPGINTDRLYVTNVVNYYDAFWSQGGHTVWYEDGSAVAHIYDLSMPVLVHEMGGHGFGKLADEYVYGPGATATEEDKKNLDTNDKPKGWNPNIDFTNSPTDIQWAHFLNDDRYKNEVGIYEGAYLWEFGAYRPTEYSVMNDVGYFWFNAPSREGIYRHIMSQSEGETWQTWKYDFEEFAKYDAVNRNASKSRAIINEADRKKWRENHRPPVFKKGTWRDAKKDHIVVPLR